MRGPMMAAKTPQSAVMPMAMAARREQLAAALARLLREFRRKLAGDPDALGAGPLFELAVRKHVVGAWGLAELGAALRRDGCRSAAREPLGEALDLAARCGARPLAARVREELKATGARPRRDWRTGLEALSPRELRVAQLAAEGRTNREIAYQLYVTLKTIEGHLARAYTKLGIERRNQLSKFFAGTKTRVPTP